MLNRRLFFRALAGSPALAIAGPGEKPVRSVMEATVCECGYQMLRHGTFAHAEEGRFYACLNPQCPHYDKPVLMPLVVLPAADPAQVARVRARERETFRYEQEFLAREKAGSVS